LNSYEQEMDRFPESYQALKMLELVLERGETSGLKMVEVLYRDTSKDEIPDFYTELTAKIYEPQPPPKILLDFCAVLYEIIKSIIVDYLSPPTPNYSGLTQLLLIKETMKDQLEKFIFFDLNFPKTALHLILPAFTIYLLVLKEEISCYSTGIRKLFLLKEIKEHCIKFIDRVSETVIDIWKCRLDAVSHTKLDVVELDNENAGRNQKLYHVTSTMVDFCHNGPPEMLLSEGVCSEPSLDYVKANFKKLANSFRDAYLKELYCEIDYGLHGPYFAISRWMKLYAQFSHPDPHVKFSINYELPQLSSKRSTPQQVSSGDQSLPMWRYFQQSRVLPLKPSFLNYSFENFGSLKPLVKMNSETEHTLKLEYLACVNKMEEKGICLNQIYCAPLISEFFPRSS